MSSSLSKLARAGSVSALVLALSACQPGDFLSGLGAGSDAAEDAASAQPQTVKLIERDVEAPDVYQTTDPALWDGRPSLGGVWVAAPGVSDPERVIIRNPANDKFVIGALFKRERTNPGPPLQLSSDAAAALGILAGAPTEINVTALRREEVPDPASAPVTLAPPAEGEGAPIEEIEASPLEDPIAAAAAALDRTEAATDTAAAATTTVAPAAAPAPTPTPAPARSTLERPFLQVGIFSIEQNATNTATALRGAGILPTVLEQESAGKTFWRVVVGPANTASERGEILRSIKRLGFEDAYAVTN